VRDAIGRADNFDLPNERIRGVGRLRRGSKACPASTSARGRSNPEEHETRISRQGSCLSEGPPDGLTVARIAATVVASRQRLEPRFGWMPMLDVISH